MNINKAYQTLSIPFIIITLLISYSCSSPSPVQEKSDEQTDVLTISKKQFEAFDMKIGGLEEQNLYSKIATRGTIDVPPGNRASIIPFHGGYIKNISILPGEKVKKGDVLFTIQNPEFIKMQQNYLEAKENLSFLKADFERQEILAAENISSQKSFKKAASQYKVVLAKVAGLKAQLQLINLPIAKIDSGKFIRTVAIYAPINGYITKVEANKGMYIDTKKVVVEITNIEHIHLELEVFEKDLMRLAEDQTILFRVPQSEDKTYEGEVHLVGKSISDDHRTVNVHGHIHETEEGKFIPGMYVEAEIITDTKAALCLPESAIIDTDGMQLILVKVAGSDLTFQSLPVSTGMKSDGWVEILNYKSLVNKEVLINGAFNLLGE